MKKPVTVWTKRRLTAASKQTPAALGGDAEERGRVPTMSGRVQGAGHIVLEGDKAFPGDVPSGAGAGLTVSIP